MVVLALLGSRLLDMLCPRTSEKPCHLAGCL